MRIPCDVCGAVYKIADEKVRGRIFRLRCKRCQTAIQFTGDGVHAADAGDGGYCSDARISTALKRDLVRFTQCRSILRGPSGNAVLASRRALPS